MRITFPRSSSTKRIWFYFVYIIVIHVFKDLLSAASSYDFLFFWTPGRHGCRGGTRYVLRQREPVHSTAGSRIQRRLQDVIRRTVENHPGEREKCARGPGFKSCTGPQFMFCPGLEVLERDAETKRTQVVAKVTWYKVRLSLDRYYSGLSSSFAESAGVP